MKHLILLLTLAFIFRPVFPVLDYAVNYEYIKTELCVNKEKPILGCNGKCYLAKQLAKAAESEKPASSGKKQILEKADLFFGTFQIAEFHFHNTNRSFNFNWSDSPAAVLPSDIFHPPAVS